MGNSIFLQSPSCLLYIKMTSEADKRDEVEEEEFEEYEYEVGSSLNKWLMHKLWETLNSRFGTLS